MKTSPSAAHYLRRLLNRLESLQRTGKIHQLSALRKKQLVKRTRKLLNRVQHSSRPISLKPAMVVLLAGLGLAAPTVSQAQAFGPVQVDPFGLALGSGDNKPAFVDLDDDGDLDLVSGDNSGGFWYYQNTGTPTAPAFANGAPNPFNLTSVPYNSNPTFVDLDNDGDFDMMSGNGYGYYGAIEVYYYTNIGDSVTPNFSGGVINPFGINFGGGRYGYYTSPSFADFDNDGDQDLLVIYNYGDFVYFQNTGTAAAPAFASPVLNPFGLTYGGYYASATVTDLDGDGDFDVVSADYYGNFRYFQNTGTISAPTFAFPLPNPFGIAQSSYYTGLSFGDLDGDGDLDLMVGNGAADFRYQSDTTQVIVPNTPPDLDTLMASTICQDSTTGPQTFMADDIDGDTVTVWGTSSNQALLPDANVNVLGTQPNFTVEATPALGQTGMATVTLFADDGMDTTSTSFLLTVDSCIVPNDPPTVTAPADDIFCVQDVYGPVAVSADDPDADPVLLTATSSNQVVIPDANITITGTQPNYMLEVVAIGTGTATITLTADDGALQTTDEFDLEVEVCTGISEFALAKEFTLFPNPATEQIGLNLELFEPTSGIRLEVVDLLGKIVYTEEILRTDMRYQPTIDVARWNTGLYSLRVSTGALMFSRKFQVE